MNKGKIIDIMRNKGSISLRTEKGFLRVNRLPCGKIEAFFNSGKREKFLFDGVFEAIEKMLEK